MKLYRIRNWARGLSPLYISICAALLLGIKSDLEIDWTSLFYFIGLISFIIASIISNSLTRRCNNYARLYDIKFSENLKKNKSHKIAQNRKSIYDIGENQFKQRTRIFQYFGVFGFGIIGLLFVISSYISSNSNHSKNFSNQNIVLQHQIDLLKLTNVERKRQISKLKKTNDSLKTIIIHEYLLNSKNRSSKKSVSFNVNKKSQNSAVN